MKPALQAALFEWHGKFLPRHFEVGARGRYGYRNRTVGYEIRKRWKFGHGKALVWTGRMRDMLKAGIAASGTSKRITGKMWSPHPLGAMIKNKPNSMADEIVAVSPPELNALGLVVSGELDKALREANKVVTVKQF